ncbi:hypothetical protein SKAU_G00428180 [Synaphobranchus kaupii]|uniref:Uncharacterized protein n=1 Tax=Synaphobranchus kaupii TaxID=118154 RepID=A0A9Q1E4U8_SYNKA|nr:hypothetical protein SKAU_G00428180 [Synaphobranchus kaupii]
MGGGRADNGVEPRVRQLKGRLTNGILKGPTVWATARVGDEDARPMMADTGPLPRHGGSVLAQPEESLRSENAPRRPVWMWSQLSRIL